MIKLDCPYCGETFPEDDLSEDAFLGIEEDMFGRDRVTFICPFCKKEVSSLRFGR